MLLRCFPIVGLMVLFSSLTAVPAAAQNNSDIASPGVAIAAIEIGRHCAGVLSVSAVAELEDYITKWVTEEKNSKDEAELAAKGDKPFNFEEFRKVFSGHLAEKYSDSRNCDAAASSEAQQYLRQVRAAVASGKPLYSSRNDVEKEPRIKH